MTQSIPTKAPPWSYSALTSFETCPKRYFHIKVAKDTKDSSGEAAIWGGTVHKYLEDRLRDGTPLPIAVAAYEGLCAPIANANGTKLIEEQIAVTSGLTPTDWDSPNAWCRGIVDAGVVSQDGSKAVLLDWKTGKRKPDSTQLKLFAGLAFAKYKELTVVKTSFIWLKEGTTDDAAFTRKDIPMIWQEFIPRVQRLERAYAETKFPPKPSGLCKNYCPVPRHKCEFSGKT